MKSHLARFIAFLSLAFLSHLAMAVESITVVTGTTGGVYYPLGGAVAKVIQAHVPNTVVNRVVGSGSVDNYKAVIDGNAQIAFGQADIAWDAFKGFNKFDKPQPLRTLAVFYPERLHLMVRDDSNIKKASDLRGKKVAIGVVGSGTVIWVSRFLSANGLDPEKDIVPHNMATADAVAAVVDKKIDAMFCACGVPVKSIEEAAKNTKLRFIDTSNGMSDMLRRHGPVYVDGSIPGNSYTGQTTAVKVAEVWNVLAVRADMKDDLAYNIVKALFEHQSELLEGGAQAKYLSMAIQSAGSPIPFHPGAKKYLTEQGVKLSK